MTTKEIFKSLRVSLHIEGCLSGNSASQKKILRSLGSGLQLLEEQMFLASHCLHPTRGLYNIQILLGTYPGAFIPRPHPPSLVTVVRKLVSVI